MAAHLLCAQMHYQLLLQETWTARSYKPPIAIALTHAKVHQDMFSHSLLYPGTHLMTLKARQEDAILAYEAGDVVLLTALLKCAIPVVYAKSLGT